MKETIIHIALFSVLLLGLCGCSKECTECSDTPQPSVPARFELNITLPTRAGSENDIPERERVKELRLIMIDDKTGNVDFNDLLDIIKPTISTDGKYRYSFHYEIETTRGTKTLYALANAENLVNDIVSKTFGKELITALEAIEMNGDFSRIRTDGAIPIISRAYKITPSVDSGIDNKVDIVMAYAATKFEFTFDNQFTTGENIRIVGWEISQVAQCSYLVPHITDEGWKGLIDLGGTTDREDWITDYDVPENPKYAGYRFTYQEQLPLLYGEEKQDPRIYYLHESKYIPSLKYEHEQEYYFTLRILLEGATETAQPIILRGKDDGKLPNLKSLIRGTHVKVNVTLKNMPEPGDNSLEVRVQSWILDDPIDGSWEEVTQNQ